jgi:hypothetical protein
MVSLNNNEGWHGSSTLHQEVMNGLPAIAPPTAAVPAAPIITAQLGAVLGAPAAPAEVEPNEPVDTGPVGRYSR